MAPVPEDEAKNVVNELESIENLDFPDVIIPPSTSDSDDLDDGIEQGGYELLPQDPVELSNAFIDVDEEETPSNGLQLLDNAGPIPTEGISTTTTNSSTTTTNTTSSNRTASSGQCWKTSEPADSHQPHLTHYPSGSAGSYLQAPELPKLDKSGVGLLWNQQLHSNTNSIKMDENHAAEIKAAMAGFKLPTSSVPDWAKNVSDDQWKDSIIPKILSSEKRKN